MRLWKIPFAVKVTIAGHSARAAIERTWTGWEANFKIEGREDGYWRLPPSSRLIDDRSQSDHPPTTRAGKMYYLITERLRDLRIALTAGFYAAKDSWQWSKAARAEAEDHYEQETSDILKDFPDSVPVRVRLLHTRRRGGQGGAQRAC